MPQRFAPEMEGRNRALAVCMLLDPRTTRLQSGTGVDDLHKSLFVRIFREEAVKVRRYCNAAHDWDSCTCFTAMRRLHGHFRKWYTRTFFMKHLWCGCDMLSCFPNELFSTFRLRRS